MTLKIANDGSNGSFNERNAGMNWLKTFLKALLIAVTALQITACSKTVQWEEEVPLNTGETIWVKRTVEYTKQGGAGNPLDTKYRPSKDQAIEFTWNGKSYYYKGEARIMLLAISPQKQPVLVAKAADNAWYARYNYACTYPFYVQLMPDETGKVWNWPPDIDTWLYNLIPNLLLSRYEPEQMQKRYTALERQAEDRMGNIGTPSQQKIDPAYTGDLCKKKEK
jgi:hypothetical protein